MSRSREVSPPPPEGVDKNRPGAEGIRGRPSGSGWSIYSSSSPRNRWGTTRSRLLLFGRRWLIHVARCRHGHHHSRLLFLLIIIIASVLRFPLSAFYFIVLVLLFVLRLSLPRCVRLRLFHLVFHLWSSFSFSHGQTHSVINRLLYLFVRAVYFSCIWISIQPVFGLSCWTSGGHILVVYRQIWSKCSFANTYCTSSLKTFPKNHCRKQTPTVVLKLKSIDSAFRKYSLFYVAALC